MSDVPGEHELYGLDGDAEVHRVGTVDSVSYMSWVAGLIAVFGLLNSLSVLLGGHTPVVIGLSLLALALACLALWLTRRVLKRPAVTPLPLNPFPMLLLPALGSDALPRMIRSVEHVGLLGVLDLIEAAFLSAGVLYLCFQPSGFRSLRKGAA